MRIGLADLKKTISRRGGVPHLVPYLLRSGELAREIEALIALHESWLGRPRESFPEDRPAELIGDFRLARCLLTCLSDWYLWQSPEWPGPANVAEATALAERGITNPGQLRLALYDHVNDTFGGYLPATQRETALDAFATNYGIARTTLDALLVLDTDPQAVLKRTTEAVPTADALAARYNQQALEAVLANAATVEWVLPAGYGEGGDEPLGTIVKRICFLARQMGVWYDVAFEDDVLPVRELPQVAEQRAPYILPVNGAEPAALSTQAERALRITLYGPQEVTSVPQAYGERLARLCRALLGYRRDPTAKGHAALADTGLSGAASVYLHGKPVTFLLDSRLLRLLRSETSRTIQESLAGAAAYDSSLEQRFAEEFAALEAAGEAQGWRLEREPEPLLLGGTILVPDFALTRGLRRVYLEIAGYWRPGYRERKARKLAELKDSVSLVVAAPTVAHAEFGALEGQIPFLWYKDRVSAQSLLGVLDTAYGDFTARLASLDVPSIRAEVAQRGRIPPTESYAVLHCYTRTEVAAAIQLLSQGDDQPPEWIEGIGLCSAAWCDELLERLRAEVELTHEGRMPLDTLHERLVVALPELADLPIASVETLAERCGLVIVRDSIFEAEVLSPEAAATLAASSEKAAPETRQRRPQPRSPARRKHSRPSYAMDSFFVPEGTGSDGGDDTGPTTPRRTAAQ